MSGNRRNKSIVRGAVIVIVVIVCVWSVRSLSERGNSAGAAAGGLFTPSNVSVSAGDTAAENQLERQPLSQTYSNSKYGFSLEYPAALQPNEFTDPQSGGDVALISEPGKTAGLQIVITSWKQNTDAITAADIEGVANLTVVEPQTVTIGTTGSGVQTGKGLAFLDGVTATTSLNRQVWFVAGGHLYQITAPAAFDNELLKILKTWHFNA